MKFPRRKFLHLAAGAVTLPALSRTAWAQAYPTRPITIVVGAAAGGPTDTIGRIITERMRVPLGQTIVIENNGAAAGSLAHGRVARAAPDGYTLSLGHWGTHVVNGAVYSLQYDVLKDFEPVALISVSPYFMVGKRDLPANDLKDFVAWLKASGDKATQGTSGAGSPGHIGGVSLQSMLGTRWLFVPYRGANPVMQALLAGDFDWTFTTPDQGLPQIRAGRIKSYAIAAKSRMALAPGIPTTDEAGLQILRDRSEEPNGAGARHSDHRRGGTARVLPFVLAWALGSQGHTKGHHRDSECSRGCRLGRAGSPSTTWRHRAGELPARAAAAGVARRLAESGDREVVAHHQGGEHQSGMTTTINFEIGDTKFRNLVAWEESVLP
jgi:tripartite-type tricarboxylate transporter receptor subunit TctC